MDGVETVAILCGGRGTRLRERTQEIPKPLVEIGGWPILWHVMRIYIAHGLRRFVLCLGYKGELIREFAAAEPWPEGVEVVCAETGAETPTGGRIKLAADELGPGTFCATYADGVADVDIARLVEFHRAHGALATVTVVRPRLQFGIAELDGGDRVSGFREKPLLEQWINGGFLCLEPGALELLDEGSELEGDLLTALAARGELRAFRHEGFWDCMDTYKDAVLLNDLWARGEPPWKVWA